MRFVSVHAFKGSPWISADLGAKSLRQIVGRICRTEAHYPYCAYNDRWSCPFPPPENRLKIGIEAGEKKFHE
ncbi:MAG: DUF1684 domain-containing protein [Chloroflexi bacterium]|nr:DUF1684 domain-containing protein [Chloroflexota bacterium]